MTSRSLADLLSSVDNIPEFLRNRDNRFHLLNNPDNPPEYTNWMAEQGAWRETCSLYDQSKWLTNFYLSGPDAVELLADLAANSFEGFGIGDAKQLLFCNHDGLVIGEGILFYIAEDDLNVVGTPIEANWLAYNIERGDYDVETRRDEWALAEAGRKRDPRAFRFQLQGPNALKIVEAAADGSVPEVPFFAIGEFSMAGLTVRGLRHGMAGQPGFELFGPYEHADEIRELLFDVGEEFGITQLGLKSYLSSSVESGYLPARLPAIYTSEALQDYREWLDADCFEAHCTIGGSFHSDDIEDYYLTPWDIGTDRVINFDHEFVGREALEQMTEGVHREKVTLVVDAAGIVDIYRSLFDEGEPYKFLDLPYAWWELAPYDEVLVEGDLVGLAKNRCYTANEREFLLVACLDTNFSDPGTEVTVTIGEGSESANPKVEPHVQRQVTATVAPAPYVEDQR